MPEAIPKQPAPHSGRHWLDELNAEQRDAATHATPSPLLVIAGAGTGKTKTLASRVAWLIENGTSPSSILLLTFTRRAAVEMLDRAGQLVGPAKAAQVVGGTFHAVANRLLRQYGPAIGLSPAFSVVDPSDSADLIDLVRSDLGFGSTDRRFPRKSTIAAIYSRVVNSRTKLDDVLRTHFPWCIEDADGIRQIVDAFIKRKREQAVLDYDDLLLWLHALLRVPGVCEEVADRFEHVLVDEYQDTNLIQSEILAALRARKKSVMVVGDDAQSIYSFRAATVENILNFPKQFENTRVIKLERNYRSVQPILDASNAVMSRANHQFAKNLVGVRQSEQKPRLVHVQDETGQSIAVCQRILDRLEQGTVLKGQAVLFRTGYHSDALEVELARRNIPFVKYGGLKFVEAAHVKDVVALLRLLTNPTDEMSWFRVLQLIEGIGPAAARKIIAGLGVTQSQSDPILTLRMDAVQVPQAARFQFAEFARAVLDCVDNKPKPAQALERIRVFYDPIFNRIYDNPQLRLRDLEQLEQIATNYTSLQQFVTDLAIDPPNSAQDLAGKPMLEEDYLVLSTIHSAKGCEWDVVHLLHVADGNMPADMACGSDAEIDEERRLFYVAMTRAKNELNLYFPLRYYFKKNKRSDKHSYAQLTRFIPPEHQRFYDHVGAHQPDAKIETTIHARRVAQEQVDALLTDLFR
jgi:DNA helicase II / ATP-dependent DNA helicase PcrA